jgi:hypothetical protein
MVLLSPAKVAGTSPTPGKRQRSLPDGACCAVQHMMLCNGIRSAAAKQKNSTSSAVLGEAK